MLEKVIDTGEAADILPVARMLAKRPYDFVHHKYAVMKFGKAIERLVRPFHQLANTLLLFAGLQSSFAALT